MESKLKGKDLSEILLKAAMSVLRVEGPVQGQGLSFVW